MNLPIEGKTRADVMASLEQSMAGDLAWQEGRTFSLVYGAGAEHLRLLREAYSLFMATNGLGAGRMFKSLATLEEELVSMSAELLGGAGCPGNVTSGGSESIILGVRAAHERARAERPRVTRPTLVLPASAHPAFDKAALIFGIRNVRTPLTKDYVADVQAMADAVTDDTIGLVASAPNYPFGTMDPVSAIAELARRHALHLHVDACVGGFALPFLRKLGQPVPSFDFAVPEVSTISADLHKYGFAARGTSLILYRDQALQRRVGFQLDDWAGGPYRTPTMAGSRPGGMIAAAWAVFQRYGEAGFLELNRTMLDTSLRLRRGIEAIPGFHVLGDPAMYVWGFASDTLDVMAVADAMAERHWYLGRQLTTPPSLHVVLTPIHAPVVDDFLRDLREVADAIGRSGRTGEKRSNYAT
ncbi:MAG TPA: pyridoxal-dependent decarboxylase [Methylomirabilota bacterium]|nr:pyridoxal-dependent decarboxylase [Methylomirabilota bacterium]